MRDIGGAMENGYGAVYIVFLRAADFAWDAVEELRGSSAMFPRPIHRMLGNE